MLRVVGLSFRSAPVEIREKVLIDRDQLGSALQELGHGVILSTCNRTEIYQSAGPEERAVDAARFLAQRLA
jgi:glutamyl-tRNA reductase